MSDVFQDFFWAFLSLIESEISQQARKGLQKCQAVIYIIVTWAETKILKDKTKQKVQVLKVFMLS